MIADCVPAIVASFFFGFSCACFCTAIKGTAIESNRTIIENCSTTVRNIIYFTIALNDKGSAQFYRNGIFTIFILQRFPVQIKGNSLACRNSDACSYIITQRYFATGSNGSL